MSPRIRGNFLLLLTAVIWGSAFVAQSAGARDLQPFAFNGLRFLLGGLFLGAVVLAFKGRAVLRELRSLALPAAVCGACLFLGSTLQQAAMGTTDPGKAGFLTALYILLVPLLRALAGHPVRPLMAFCVALALVGMWLLCMSGGFGQIASGDLLLLGCALAFAVHILTIDRFAARVDPLALSALQFLVTGILSLPFIVLREGWPAAAAFRAAAVPFLYAALFSCCLGYTLQTVAQRDTDPTVASLIMCLESVFALVAGMLLLGERHTLREFLGCFILFAAILLAQLPQAVAPPTAKSSTGARG